MTLETGVKALAEAVAVDVKALEDGKVDKADGKGLSTEDYTSLEKTKLAGIQAGAQVNAVTSVSGRTGAVTLAKGDVGLSNVDNTSDVNKPLSTATTSALSGKVDKVTGKGLSESDYTTAEKTKLAGIAVEATKNRADSENADKVHTHPVSQVTGLGTAATKDVGLSTGQVMEVGTFGYGAQNPVNNTYDVNDLPAGQRLSLSDSFTEADAVALNLPALGGLGTTSRSWHVECIGSGTTRSVQYATEVYGQGTTRGRTFIRVKHDATWHPWEEVPKANVDGKLSTNWLKTDVSTDPLSVTDVVLTRGAYGIGDVGTLSSFTVPTSLIYNSFWGGNCITVNSKESPYASMLILDKDKLTYGSVTEDDGILAAEIITDKNQVVLGTTAATARSALELGTAATKDVGTGTGQVMQVGAFGVGHTFTAQVFDANDIADQVDNKSGFYPYGSDLGSTNVPYAFVYIYQLFVGPDIGLMQIAYGYNTQASWIRTRQQGVWTPWVKQLSTSDILQTTGTSTEFPMSQAATTSQLDTKAPLSHTHPWSQVTGQPATATRWPTLAEVTGKPANYPTDWATVSDKPIVQTVGTSTTNLMSQKAVSDLFASMQPQLSITGSCTTNGTTDNTLVLTGIVSALALEVGDVIQITGSTGGLNDKLFTVESITDDNSIIVNYEHAGNRGNGSLKLADQTATVTIERIAKWYNAPLGLGQDWVEVTASRAPDTNYTNTTRRAIFVSVISTTTTAAIGFALLVGGTERSAQLMGRTDITKIIQVGTLTPAGSNYKVGALELFSIPSISIWSELR